NNDWIVSRTGIHERRIADAGETTASLAAEAALNALRVAGISPDALDLIIVATSSPEHVFPATACLVQDRIGAAHAGAFDLSAACSGFIYALQVASQSIRTGAIKNALVIGAETLSRLVNWQDRNTCILFGDGAGAFVVQAGEEPSGVLSAILRSDGSGGDLLSIPSSGSHMPVTAETIQQGLNFIQMNGREVFRFASRVMAQATQEALELANLKIEDINLIVPHQANLRILEAAARGLKIPLDRLMINLDRYGNTSTASIPIATCEAIQQGRLLPNDHVVFVGFGAGLTWGAVVAQWSGPFTQRKKIYPARYRAYARIRSYLLRLLRRVDAWIWSGRNQNNTH
ncbi:MAG TPA: beta-ketoacyl-ACP synthase III, partial [Anaerolineales bacterium]|nr:beta-ketoacyl-ACP synthase III [Anaerolineales bacterium]